MVAKKGQKAGRKVKSLKTKGLSAKKAGGVKGGAVPHGYIRWNKD